jgi:hypothetical protein
MTNDFGTRIHWLHTDGLPEVTLSQGGRPGCAGTAMPIATPSMWPMSALWFFPLLVVPSTPVVLRQEPWGLVAAPVSLGESVD